MKRLLILLVLFAMLALAVEAGHTIPGAGPGSQYCECSEPAQPCYDDLTGAPLPLCK